MPTPLDAVVDDVFPCADCGRPLKVPAALRKVPVATPPAATGDATTFVAAVEPGETGTRAERQAAKRAAAKQPKASADYSMPKWLRFLVWIAAVPVALVLVLVPARLLHLVSAGTLIDVVTGEKAVRFVSLVPLLASWALSIAVVVMLGTDGVTWFVRRRAAAARSAAPGALDSQTSH